MRCSLYVRDVKLRGAAQNPRANPHVNSIPLGQGWSSGGCSALVSCFMRPESKTWTPHPISEFPSRLQRTASSTGTSISAAPIDLAAARTCSAATYHVWRQGAVHSSLWCLLEGHFRWSGADSIFCRALIICYQEKDGFRTSLTHSFSINIRLRIWYIFITTIPKQVCFIVKVELPSVSIEVGTCAQRSRTVDRDRQLKAAVRVGGGGSGRLSEPALCRSPCACDRPPFIERAGVRGWWFARSRAKIWPVAVGLVSF